MEQVSVGVLSLPWAEQGFCLCFVLALPCVEQGFCRCFNPTLDGTGLLLGLYPYLGRNMVSVGVFSLPWFARLLILPWMEQGLS